MIKKRVLIAEDDPDTRFLLSLVLNEHGYDVVTAADGIEALALAEQHPPDLMIFDQMMPRMTGTQLAAEVAKVQPDLPVILYTGFNEGIPRSEVEAARVRAVATKPIDPHQLFGLLRTHLPAS